jgi:hypothetical protein
MCIPIPQRAGISARRCTLDQGTAHELVGHASCAVFRNYDVTGPYCKKGESSARVRGFDHVMGELGGNLRQRCDFLQCSTDGMSEDPFTCISFFRLNSANVRETVSREAPTI